MKIKNLLLSFLILAVQPLNGQEIRNSLFQYQFNALALNPAYSSYLPGTGFEATYLGSFTDQGALSRSVILNMQGATEKGGLGMTFQFYKNNNFGEVNLRPAWSRRLSLSSGNEIAFGIVIGLNYFDAINSFFSAITNDFISADAGFGVYYHSDHYFAGISVLNFVELTAGLDATILRENPFSFHAGGVIPLSADIELKPVVLARYTNVYELPDQTFQNAFKNYSLDLQVNIFIQNSYIIGLLYGFTDQEIFGNLNRVGISASYVLGNFRLTYAIQNNSQADSAVSLPVTHIISAGYDISGEEVDVPFRYF